MRVASVGEGAARGAPLLLVRAPQPPRWGGGHVLRPSRV